VGHDQGRRTRTESRGQDVTGEETRAVERAGDHRLDRDQPVPGIEKERPDLLPVQGPETLEEVESRSRRGDGRALVRIPALGQFPESGQPNRLSWRDPMVTHQPNGPQRASLPEGEPRQPAGGGEKGGWRFGPAENLGDQLVLRTAGEAGVEVTEEGLGAPGGVHGRECNI
jgi:hypothetical protein